MAQTSIWMRWGGEVAAAGMREDGEFPGIHAGGDLDGFGYANGEGVLGFEGLQLLSYRSGIARGSSPEPWCSP